MTAAILNLDACGCNELKATHMELTVAWTGRGEKLKRLTEREGPVEEVWGVVAEETEDQGGRKSVMSRHLKEEAGPSSQKAPKVECRVPNFRNGRKKMCCLQVTHLWSFFIA